MFPGLYVSEVMAHIKGSFGDRMYRLRKTGVSRLPTPEKEWRSKEAAFHLNQAGPRGLWPDACQRRAQLFTARKPLNCNDTRDAPN
jgi:hypothetical protein